MSNPNGISAYVCDGGHVHLELIREGKKIGSFMLDIEDWFEMVEDLDREIGEYLDKQTIGMCKGNA